MDIDPIWSRLVDKIEIDPISGCWLWTGAKTDDGYAKANSKETGQIYVHVWMYERLIGPKPAGKVSDHLCRRRHCVNPNHLEPVTQRQNILRGVGPPSQNAVKSHCPKGHPLSGPNVYIWRGNRRCRICTRETWNRMYRKRKQSQQQHG